MVVCINVNVGNCMERKVAAVIGPVMLSVVSGVVREHRYGGSAVCRESQMNVRTTLLLLGPKSI